MSDNSKSVTQQMPSVPMPKPSGEGMMQRLDEFLDQHVLPYPVKFLTNRVVILLTLSMLIPLIVFASNQVVVLLLNSYLNTMSVVVSSTVLLFSTLGEVRDRAAAQRREEIAKTHEAMVEARAESDHKLIEDIHTHLDDIHAEVMQHVSASVDAIQKTHQEELADLRKLIEPLKR